jgi:protein subunit release factor A
MKTLRRRLEEIERQIHDLEDRMRGFAETLSDPELYKDGDRVRTVATERKSAEERVAWLMREWEELSVELSAHE